MAEYKINAHERCANTSYTMNDLTRAMHVVDGVIKACANGEYVEGMRNTIIVDLGAGCMVLGLNPCNVLEDVIGNGYINPADDDEDTRSRMYCVRAYTSEWSGHEFYKMFDEDYWTGYSEGDQSHMYVELV